MCAHAYMFVVSVGKVLDLAPSSKTDMVFDCVILGLFGNRVYIMVCFHVEHK